MRITAKRHKENSRRACKGRMKWCVIFPYPLIADDKTRKPGVRVRRGLGTDDQTEAQAKKINVMLGNQDYWKGGAMDAGIPVKWWRRRELNPRPCLINQPRLHA